MKGNRLLDPGRLRLTLLSILRLCETAVMLDFHPAVHTIIGYMTDGAASILWEVKSESVTLVFCASKLLLGPWMTK